MGHAVIILVVVMSVVEKMSIVVEVRLGMSYAVMRMKYAVGISMVGYLLIIVTHPAGMRSRMKQAAAKIMKIHSNAQVVNK
jgi:hypothetical protein